MKKIVLSFFVFFPIIASAQLKINEIMPKNVSAVMDDSYNYSMWVELYNSSTTTYYNQATFYFTDSRSTPTQWRPVSRIIAPGGFSLLWFERDERAGHANFKLDPDGGKLYMFNAGLQLVDSVFYPAQYRNVSYGRLTDGGNDWVFFDECSAQTSNNGKKWAYEHCANPVFANKPGFYPSSINVKFEIPAPGDTIYYTLNNQEPTKQNAIKYVPGFVISLTRTTSIRAICISATRLSSDVITGTYLIGERDFNLPVVSIVTNQANLTDNTIGIYVEGTNGLTGNGMTTPANWNQDWDRPVNVELFDTTGVSQLNQEVDINIAGAWSRKNPQKTLKVNSKSKFGNNRLNYDFFKSSKPGMEYKSILLRNSGNDFYYSMMRDAFMQSVVAKRMNLDLSAYEPAVCFMNGVYYGIQNLRERSDNDYVFSNYGFDDQDIKLVETGEMAKDTSFLKLSAYVSANDITQPVVYANVCKMMDVDNFMSYFMSEIYFGNTDWPDNNVKVWKKKINGQWRWIMYDTDFGFNLYDQSLYNHNSLLYALGEKTDDIPAAWSTLLLRRLMLNDTFRTKFIDRFSIQLSSTFEQTRVNHILDSLAVKIKNEIVYHKSKWTSYRDLTADINNMKVFSANRPAAMFGFITGRFLTSGITYTLNLSANIPKASYTLNSEQIMDAAINLKYYENRPMALQANAVPGYKFKQWELSSGASVLTLIPMGSTWKYNDGSTIPATNWNATSYSDLAWNNGVAQLGYGGKGEVTTIGYGGVSTNKYTTAYFRKTFSIADISSKSNFVISAFVDDGAAVYVNGVEIGRYNMPTGTLSFATLSSTSNNGVNFSLPVPLSALKAGDNVIAVEVHQSAATSSDLIFNLQLTCNNTVTTTVLTAPVYNTTLTQNQQLKAIYEVSGSTEDNLPTVRINEVLPSNALIPDEFGSVDDYIELYNYGTKNVNIAGWYLTDLPVNRTLFQFPTTDSTKTNIPAKGRIIVWADSEPLQGVLHAGLKLSKDGETLILSRKNLQNEIQLIDSVSFPPLGLNLTYSRIPDGALNWMIRPTTYNASNGVIDALETPETDVQVYPTTVNETFVVNNAIGQQLKIIDLTGKILLQKRITDEHETIPVGFLQRGLYILNVGDTSLKLIKI